MYILYYYIAVVAVYIGTTFDLVAPDKKYSSDLNVIIKCIFFLCLVIYYFIPNCTIPKRFASSRLDMLRLVYNLTRF